MSRGGGSHSELRSRSGRSTAFRPEQGVIRTTTSQGWATRFPAASSCLLSAHQEIARELTFFFRSQAASGQFGLSMVSASSSTVRLGLRAPQGAREQRILLALERQLELCPGARSPCCPHNMVTRLGQRVDRRDTKLTQLVNVHYDRRWLVSPAADRQRSASATICGRRRARS